MRNPKEGPRPKGLHGLVGEKHPLAPSPILRSIQLLVSLTIHLSICPSMLLALHNHLLYTRNCAKPREGYLPGSKVDTVLRGL